MTKASEPRRIDDVHEGLFRVRLCRGGPWVAARIEHGEYGWKGFINGESQGFANVDPFMADGVQRIWLWGVEITKAEYDQLAKTPHANPRLKVDLNSERPPF